MTQNLKLQIGFADRQISADYLSKENARILNLAENDLALAVREKTYLANGRIVSYAEGVLYFKKMTLFPVPNHLTDRRRNQILKSELKFNLNFLVHSFLDPYF